MNTVAALTKSLPLDRIISSPYQSREDFDEKDLKSLAATIKKHGLQQAVLVRPTAPPPGQSGEWYELVDGERRCRACRLLQMSDIEAKIVEMSENEAARRGCIANAQRKDLNPIERARSFELLSKKFGLTGAQIAEEAGLDEPSGPSRIMSLLTLPEEVQENLRRRKLSSSQGTEIARLPSAKRRIWMANKCIKEG